MKELLCFVVGSLVFGVVLMTPLIGIAMWGAYATCGSQSSKMGLEYSWGPLQDCMVKVDGSWMMLDSYKLIVKVRP